MNEKSNDQESNYDSILKNLKKDEEIKNIESVGDSIDQKTYDEIVKKLDQFLWKKDLPFDVRNKKTQELIIPKKKRISKQDIKSLINAYPNLEMESHPLGKKINDIIFPENEQFFDHDHSIEEIQSNIKDSDSQLTSDSSMLDEIKDDEVSTKNSDKSVKDDDDNKEIKSNPDQLNQINKETINLDQVKDNLVDKLNEIQCLYFVNLLSNKKVTLSQSNYSDIVKSLEKEIGNIPQDNHDKLKEIISIRMKMLNNFLSNGSDYYQKKKFKKAVNSYKKYLKNIYPNTNEDVSNFLKYCKQESNKKSLISFSFLLLIVLIASFFYVNEKKKFDDNLMIKQKLNIEKFNAVSENKKTESEIATTEINVLIDNYKEFLNGN